MERDPDIEPDGSGSGSGDAPDTDTEGGDDDEDSRAGHGSSSGTPHNPPTVIFPPSPSSPSRPPSGQHPSTDDIYFGSTPSTTPSTVHRTNGIDEETVPRGSQPGPGDQNTLENKLWPLPTANDRAKVRSAASSISISSSALLLQLIISFLVTLIIIDDH